MILIGKADEEELMNLVPEKKGSLVTYFGYVRERSNGKEVKYMVCSEKESSHAILEDIENEIKSKFPIDFIILYHSVGKLKVGDLISAVIVSSVHREEGFDACRLGINLIKKKEPVKRIEF